MDGLVDASIEGFQSRMKTGEVELRAVLIIILASDISSSGQVALAIFAVLSNFLVWLWNDVGIKDVQAGLKDITCDDAETAIAQEFKKAPWAFYRGIVVVIALATAGSELYALFG